jgi:Mlc titration factor MtfA (ptsG expression regulator)
MGITVAVVFSVMIYVLFRKDLTKEKVFDVSAFLPKWRLILFEHVAFYNSLNDEEKKCFESNILEFLSQVRVTGIDVKIDDTDEF